MPDNIQKLYKIAGVDIADFDIYTLRDEYPPFTAEKQLELIKWLVRKNDTNIEIANADNGTAWDICFDYHSIGYTATCCDEDLDQALAGLINDLWQDLTDKQKQEIKEILQLQ